MLSWKVSLLLLGLVQFAACGLIEKFLVKTARLPADQQKQRADLLIGKFKEQVEKLRGQLAAGFPDANIPPLDPFKAGSHKLGPADWGLVGKFEIIDFNDITITGLKDLQISNAEIDFNKLDVTLNVTLPSIKVTGSYKLLGKLTIFNIDAEGPFEVLINDVKLGGTAKVKTLNGKLQVDRLKFSLSVGDVKFNFSGAGNTGRDISNALSSVSTYAIDYLSPVVTTIAASALKAPLNKFLADVDYDTFLKDNNLA